MTPRTFPIHILLGCPQITLSLRIMKANSNLVIEGSAVMLVPYRHEHVELYHRWMADPFLQQTTESEPLR